MTQVVARNALPKNVWQLEQDGVHPLLARLYAARRIADVSELNYTLDALLAPDALTNNINAARLLADAILAEEKLLIIADYDCDGATACAVGIRALRSMGAKVDYMVPDRFKLGYGLSPEIVTLAAKLEPDLIITVDNGIADIAGVSRARELGIKTLITDHHLPGASLPEADCIVNPNQPDCSFPSKSIAGVGVIFYVMLALRKELRQRDYFNEISEPNLAKLLDLVALGTVADVVPLDRNNRILVNCGLERIRKDQMQVGVRALFQAVGKNPRFATVSDFGFLIGPRLNAAGRLADMSLGIECLISDNPVYVLNIAQELDQLNRVRRQKEAEMQEQAEQLLYDMKSPVSGASISLFNKEWHQGIVGILAARIKDKWHRPVFAFACSENGQIKGSGRSIAGFHLRDALDLISKRAPQLLVNFGGHAAAAGVTLLESDFQRFQQLFEQVGEELIDASQLEHVVETDGALEDAYYSLHIAKLLEKEVWGQGMPAPLFTDCFEVLSQKILKDKHVKLKLKKSKSIIEGIQFNQLDVPDRYVQATFRLERNEFRGMEQVQLNIVHLEKAQIQGAH